MRTELQVHMADNDLIESIRVPEERNAGVGENKVGPSLRPTFTRDLPN
jgi:hypothetical protein